MSRNKISIYWKIANFKKTPLLFYFRTREIKNERPFEKYNQPNTALQKFHWMKLHTCLRVSMGNVMEHVPSYSCNVMESLYDVDV